MARIALTPGEPAGIGPDLALTLASETGSGSPLVIADPELLEARAAALELPVRLRIVDRFSGESPPPEPAVLDVFPVPCGRSVTAGRPSTENARYVLETLRIAAEGCLQGRFAAMVTGPVHKGVINEAGIPFSGHTEFLAALAGGQPVMMLATPELRVALVTTHLPLQEVPGAVTRERLQRVARTLDRDLRARFAIPAPRILVCGLNPHAGEGGHLGREEIEVISPVLDGLRREGLDIRGPLPADTVFTPDRLRTADAVLAMYHDQGLPVLKHAGFGKAVNITLGLPLLRTSVDHGTAFELAGTGKADPGSLRAALDLAQRLAANRPET